MSYQSPRIMLAEIRLGWMMCTSPGKTLGQSDWPETTQKGVPPPQNLGLRAIWQSVRLGDPYQ